MEKLLKSTRIKFTVTIIMVVLSTVTASWSLLQFYNKRQIAVPANADIVHSSAEGNAALTEYLEEQKDFEAHFISLATAVKEQDSKDMTKALALVSAFMLAVGVLVAFIVAKKLVKPVRDAYESQERFIQDAAHELRNPLAAMTAALQKAGPTKSNDPLVMTFKRQTKRLININEDLLFLERRSKQEPIELKLDDLLSDVVEEVQPLAAGKNVKIKIDRNDAIVKKMASSDYVRLVKNIIDNAVKYSKNDSVVSISQSKQKGSIKIVVADKGIGIPAEDLDSIGNRFFRAENTNNIEGTGLGLAIVQKILNVYGGDFSIESKINKGTTVTISLPA